MCDHLLRQPELARLGRRRSLLDVERSERGEGVDERVTIRSGAEAPAVIATVVAPFSQATSTSVSSSTR